MSKGKKVDERMFSICKGLLKGGVPRNEIIGHLNISSTSISHINSSETYDEYCERRRASCAKLKAPNANEPSEQNDERVQNVTVLALTHFMDNKLSSLEKTLNSILFLMQNMDNKVKSLNVIADRLGYLMDALDAWPKGLETEGNNDGLH